MWHIQSGKQVHHTNSTIPKRHNSTTFFSHIQYWWSAPYIPWTTQNPPIQKKTPQERVIKRIQLANCHTILEFLLINGISMRNQPISIRSLSGWRANLHPIHHSSVFILHLLATAAHVQSLTPRSWNCCCFSTGQARIRIVMVSRKQSSPDLLRATVLGMEVFFIVIFLVLLIIITKQIRLQKAFTNLSSHKSLDMIPSATNPPSKKNTATTHQPTLQNRVVYGTGTWHGESWRIPIQHGDSSLQQSSHCSLPTSHSVPNSQASDWISALFP